MTMPLLSACFSVHGAGKFLPGSAALAAAASAPATTTTLLAPDLQLLQPFKARQNPSGLGWQIGTVEASSLLD